MMFKGLCFDRMAMPAMGIMVSVGAYEVGSVSHNRSFFLISTNRHREIAPL